VQAAQVVRPSCSRTAGHLVRSCARKVPQIRRDSWRGVQRRQPPRQRCAGIRDNARGAEPEDDVLNGRERPATPRTLASPPHAPELARGLGHPRQPRLVMPTDVYRRRSPGFGRSEVIASRLRLISATSLAAHRFFPDADVGLKSTALPATGAGTCWRGATAGPRCWFFSGPARRPSVAGVYGPENAHLERPPAQLRPAANSRAVLTHNSTASSASRPPTQAGELVYGRNELSPPPGLPSPPPGLLAPPPRAARRRSIIRPDPRTCSRPPRKK
jgi:hypothetical protein